MTGVASAMLRVYFFLSRRRSSRWTQGWVFCHGCCGRGLAGGGGGRPFITRRLVEGGGPRAASFRGPGEEGVRRGLGRQHHGGRDTIRLNPEFAIAWSNLAGMFKDECQRLVTGGGDLESM